MKHEAFDFRRSASSVFRRSILVAIPVASVIGLTAAAYAAIQHFTAGEPLTQAKMNANFDDIDTRLKKVETAAVVPIRSEVWVRVSNGYGSTNTAIRRFNTIVRNTGTAITYASSAGLGDSFTINEAGIYAITYGDGGGPIGQFGVSLNSSQLTSALGSVNPDDILVGMAGQNSDVDYTVAVTTALKAGDVIRAHASANAGTTNSYGQLFHIVRLNN